MPPPSPLWPSQKAALERTSEATVNGDVFGYTPEQLRLRHAATTLHTSEWQQCIYYVLQCIYVFERGSATVESY